MQVARWFPAVVGIALGPRSAWGQAAPDGLGRLEGVVTIGPALEARRLNLRLYPDVGGSPVPAGGEEARSERQNVVIYVDSLPWDGRALPDRGPVAIRQRNEMFEPHVTAVVRGTTVAFPNDDPVFHNVFSLSRARSFDLGQYPRGQSKSVTFDREGVVQVFCHIHADMSAVVLVLGNPLYAMPDPDGRYVIEGVPSGDRVIVAWHERTRPVVRRVRVEAGGVSRVDWTIPLSSERQPRD
jgi:plastocyanin